MITDEQVNQAIEIIKYAERHNVRACLDEFKKIGQHAIAPEVFVRQVLENYENGKWISVDTPPTKDGAYLTNLGEAFFVATGHGTNRWRPRFTRHEFGTSSIKGITHWQHLPTFKETS